MDHHNYTRRQALTKAGVAGTGLVLAGGGLKFGVPGFESEEALAAGACIMTPEKTIGPYFVEENLNRVDVKADPAGTNPQPGTNLALTMYVFDYANGCAPVAGAKVDIWHANALGKYSDVQQNGTVGQKWLRGFQTSDASGKVSFQTIFPGFYQGRTIHIHVRVRVGTQDFTTQIFFDEGQTATIMGTAPYSGNNGNGTRLTNANDGIYTQGANGSQLLVSLAPDGAGGYSTEFSAGIGGSSSTGTGNGTTTTDKVVSVALSALRMVRYRHGHRTLRVRFKVKETVYVTAQMSRRKKVMVERSKVKLTAGTKVLKLKVPRKYGAGAAKLTLKVADAKGNSKTYSRAVHVPRKKS